MEMMTLESFYSVYKDLPENELILDVRTPEEFSEGHIEKAQNINHTNVLEWEEKLKEFSRIYIYCRRGARAQFAAAALKERGLENLVCIFDAGTMKWKEQGYPLVK